MSNLIKEMLVDDDGESIPEIPLPNVEEAILEKVVAFCTHHVNDPMSAIEKPLKSTNMAKVVSAWYVYKRYLSS
jgi:S-phase kinase-associated protein 1